MQRSIARVRTSSFVSLIFGLICAVSFPTRGAYAKGPASPPETGAALAAALGVHFVEGSNSSLVLERDGKQYLVNLTTRTVEEGDVAPQAAVSEPNPTRAALPQAAQSSDSGA